MEILIEQWRHSNGNTNTFNQSLRYFASIQWGKKNKIICGHKNVFKLNKRNKTIIIRNPFELWMIQNFVKFLFFDRFARHSMWRCELMILGDAKVLRYNTRNCVRMSAFNGHFLYNELSQWHTTDTTRKLNHEIIKNCIERQLGSPPCLMREC